MARVARRAGFVMTLLLALGWLVLTPVRGETITPGQEAVDQLFLLVFILALVIGIVVEGLLIAAIVLFRRKEGQYRLPTKVKTKDAKLELIWTALPALIIAIVAGGSFYALQITDTIPEPDFTVEVIGHQFYFEFVYPDGSSSENLLRVEEGRVVRLNVTSSDVVHSYFIPAFRLKVDAVPGQTNVYWFQAQKAGTYSITCAEYCGVGHFTMRATLEVFPAGSQAVPYGPSA